LGEYIRICFELKHELLGNNVIIMIFVVRSTLRMENDCEEEMPPISDVTKTSQVA